MDKPSKPAPAHPLHRRLISCALSGAILVLSPGLPAYQAMAQSISAVGVGSAVQPVPGGIAGAGMGLRGLQSGGNISLAPSQVGLGGSLQAVHSPQLAPQSAPLSASLSAPAAASVSKAVPSAVSAAVAPTVSPLSAPAAAVVSKAVPSSVSPAVARAVSPKSAPAATVVSRVSPSAVSPTSAKSSLVAGAAAMPKLSGLGVDAAKEVSGRMFDGVAARSEGSQTPAVAAAGEVSGRSGLAPSVESAPQSAPAATAVSKVSPPVVSPAVAQAVSPAPSRARLFLKTLGISGLFLAVDWGAKALFKLGGLHMVYHVMESYRAPLMPATIPLSIALMAYYLWSSHASEPMLKKLDDFRKRHPIVGNALYFTLQALTFPTGIDSQRYAGDLARKHPAIRTALAMLRIGLAAVVAGTIGNGLEGLFLGKVIDFIPFGKATANISDLYIFAGLPFVWMTLDFFKAARKAVETRTPAEMSWWKYFLPFVLGQVGFIYTTMGGYANVPMLGWYLTIFSTLFLVGSTVSAMILQPAVNRFNRSFRLADSPALSQDAVRSYLSPGYRARRALAAGLASLLAVLPFHKTVSAPRMGESDRQALVERYRQVKPRLVLMDWDKTFMDNPIRNNEPVTEERLELLRALKAAGIRAGFVTNRPLQGKDFGMASLLMERMDPELRKDFILSTGGGSEIYKYGPQGETPDGPKLFTSRIEAKDMETMSGILRAEAVRLGIDAGHGGRDFAEERKPYELTFIVRNQKEKIQDLFATFEAAFKAQGLDKTLDAKLKIPVKAGAAPYIRVRPLGANKAGGVRGILSVLKEEGKTVEPEEVLFFGDEFDPGNDDVYMAESLPAATAFAVGRTLDPRVRNAHLLPAVGSDSTAGFLWDILGGRP